jgi:1-acyl-sn-glycerol-3-phosphate acyltransferase
VLLSHANLLANIRALGEACEVGADDVSVSWLPLYHDMGLIGAWLGPLHHGIPAVVLSPLTFLSHPASWLQAITLHGGTISPAPNFAFDLCARRIEEADLAGLDLSRWRLAFNGSEPVRAETLERFARRFAPCGFRREALCPVYGLAEASVGLTVTPPGRGPRVDRIDRDAFARERVARPAPADAAALEVVSCGAVLRGHEVRVVDGAGRGLPERREGRILFRGPSVTAGYFRNPEATARARVDGWMDSGDLGYLAGGELFVTGRVKDLVIKAGRNLHPQEIEGVAGEIAGIRRGRVAAFGVTDAALGTERLVVVAETRQRSAAAREALRRAVIERVTAALGVPPDVVAIAPPGTVVKTSSGKIRRTATRDVYLAGGRRRPGLAARLAGLRGPAAVALGRGAEVLAIVRAGAVVAATLPALWARIRWARDGGSVDAAVRRWCRLVLAGAGCRLDVEGLEHLPAAGPFVLAANHTSYVDVVALLAALPVDFRFVAKRELLRAPLVGAVIRRVGHLTVDRVDAVRGIGDAGRVAAALAAGTSVLVFPEGTFAEAAGLLPFRLGAFSAAVDAARPVVPVTLVGTREVLPADTWVPRPGPIRVIVGRPLWPAGREWRETVRLRDATRAEIARAA